jgi:alkylation response protein AidB-like acyl-CoA dehydrogenase
LGYVKDRRQFGRPIGEFQALQHRLAELTVIVEGARWLALEAAFRDAAPLSAATAAGRAAGAASLVARECHQMHGAIGLTREYPLHLWSVRLGPLAVELGGPLAHRREATRLRFSPEEISAREAYWR